jgi:hypothetical protein
MVPQDVGREKKNVECSTERGWGVLECWSGHLIRSACDWRKRRGLRRSQRGREVVFNLDSEAFVGAGYAGAFGDDSGLEDAGGIEMEFEDAFALVLGEACGERVCKRRTFKMSGWSKIWEE